jgi:hypothetical protein
MVSITAADFRPTPNRVRRLNGKPTLAEIGKRMDSFQVTLESGQRQRLHVVKTDRDIEEYTRRDAVAFAKHNEPGIDRPFLERIVEYGGIALYLRDRQANMYAGFTLIDQPMDDAGSRFVAELPYGKHYVEGAFALSPAKQAELGDVLEENIERTPPRNSQLFGLEGRGQLSLLAGASGQVVSFAGKNWATSRNLTLKQFEARRRTKWHFGDRPGTIRFLGTRNLEENHVWTLPAEFRRVQHHRDLYQSMKDGIPAFAPMYVPEPAAHAEIAEVMSDAFFEGWRGLFYPQLWLPKADGRHSADGIRPDERGVLFVPPFDEYLQRTPIVDLPTLEGIRGKGPGSLV